MLWVKRDLSYDISMFSSLALLVLTSTYFGSIGARPKFEWVNFCLGGMFRRKIEARNTLELLLGNSRYLYSSFSSTANQISQATTTLNR